MATLTARADHQRASRRRSRPPRGPLLLPDPAGPSAG